MYINGLNDSKTNLVRFLKILWLLWDPRSDTWTKTSENTMFDYCENKPREKLCRHFSDMICLQWSQLNIEPHKSHSNILTVLSWILTRVRKHSSEFDEDLKVFEVVWRTTHHAVHFLSTPLDSFPTKTQFLSATQYHRLDELSRLH